MTIKINKKINISQVYITHYKKLKDRKKYIQKQMLKYNLQYIFIENEPCDAFLVDDSLESWHEKTIPLNYHYKEPYRKIKQSEISLSYKHIYIYKEIIKNKIETALILEDDVILDCNFIKKFNFLLSKTPEDWDVIFIGSGCGLRVNKDKIQVNQYSYLKKHPASKCTDSYVIKKSAVAKIIPKTSSISMPIDFELNYWMFINNLNVYWWEPPIVRQGSQIRMFPSEIQ